MSTWPTYSDGYREGYRAGQLAMRERAAKKSERKSGTRCSMHEFTGEGCCGLDIAEEIRALEPEEPE